MRKSFLPRPKEEELETLEAHELIRDYPELLPFLRHPSFRVREGGTSPFPRGSIPGGIEEGTLSRCLAWRREGKA
jgi:hypothetical protein